MESCIQSEEYQIAEASKRNLIVHLAVAIMRIRTAHLVQETNLPPSANSPEERIARCIALRIKQQYGVEFPEEEIDYVQIHLRGKRFFMEDNKGHLITGELEQLMGKINNAIKEELGMDFRLDLDHFAALSLHLFPMLTRVKYGLRMENPVLYDVKRQLPLGYECAVVAANVIASELGCEVTEDEQGYLAMHYAVAIDHLKKPQNISVAVVCSSGLGTSRLLKHKVTEQFGLSEKQIVSASAHGLPAPHPAWLLMPFVFLGGCGATLALELLMLAKARSQTLRTLARLSLPTSIFNINEPLIFGAPVVFNSLLGIPFVLTPMLNLGICYLSIEQLHLIPFPTGAEVSVYYPVGIASALTCGSLRALALCAVLLLVDCAVYFPFFKRYDRIKWEEECKNSCKNCRQ